MNSPSPFERRQLTVMFCDVVGSTVLARELDPEELTDLIRVYRRRCAEVVKSHGGIVAQFVGDGVLAYFGYPQAHEDDAERTIHAALALARTDWAAAGAKRIAVRLGIATGVVVVGRLPEEDLSAVGSPLNLAARLQGLADAGAIVVAEQTRRLTRGLFLYRDLGAHRLGGFEAPVPAWQVIGERRVRSRFRALRAATLTPLVDREAEVQVLCEDWAWARAGQGRAILFSAEPGVGKSRLAEVLSTKIVERERPRLGYYCAPNLQSTPLAPVVRQLASAARFAPGDDDATRLRKLESVLPAQTDDEDDGVALVADLLSIRIEERRALQEMSPQRQRQALFRALLRALHALAARGPVLILVEDLHWMDPSSDELLGMVIDAIAEWPVLVVLTTRPEFDSPWRDRPHVRHWPLRSLERADTLAMIELVCGSDRLPRATVDAIADKTDGLPLFIEDLTRDVLELAAGAGDASAPLPVAIPSTLNDSLMSRLDRLGTAKAIAQVGAAIGREFSRELLARVAGVPEEQLREALSRLSESGLVAARRTTASPGYAFKHALVRDAAYASLLKKEQVALHGRIARALVEDFAETAETQPQLVAQHARSAGEIGLAVEYLIKAAKLSAKRSGFVEAIAQLEDALALLASAPAESARARRELDVYRTLGGINAEYRGFASAACGEAYACALERCRELGNPPELFSVLSGLGAVEITRARFATCRDLAQECLARATEQGAKPPFVMGHLLQGGTSFLTGEFGIAREHLEQALALYEQDTASRRNRQVLYVQDQKSTGLCYLALALTIMGRVEEGVQAGEHGLEHSRSLGGPHTVNFSLCYLAAVYCIAGRFDLALARAAESLAVAHEQGFATWTGISAVVHGTALVRAGAQDEGRCEVERGVEAHEATGAVAYRPFALALLASALLATARHEEALDRIDQALATSERNGESFYLAELWRVKAEILARGGEVEHARTCLHAGVAVAREQQARLFELRAAVDLCRLAEPDHKSRLLRDVLEPAYRAFEGRAETDIVRDARAMLAGAA